MSKFKSIFILMLLIAGIILNLAFFKQDSSSERLRRFRPRLRVPRRGSASPRLRVSSAFGLARLPSDSSSNCALLHLVHG